MSATQLLNPKAESRVSAQQELDKAAANILVEARRSSQGQYIRWRRPPGCSQVESGAYGYHQNVRRASTSESFVTNG